MESTVNRIAIYARVSTSDQSPQMQIDELRDYAQRRGWIIAGEYIDIGQSGAKEARPALTRMLKDAHSRACDGILVWKIDRLARSLKHLVNCLAELDARGVAFVSLRDGLDLSTPAGRLQLHIIGAMAEFERSLIVERVTAGIAAARRRGVKIGRPKTYVSPDKVREMREAGTPWRAIAKKLKIGTGTACRALQQAS
jgi:DNA invertase Pin-like site-specific DNA recombinase